MIRRLLLVRHGVTTWNREGRFQGHLDSPLDPLGEEEARALAGRIVREYSGPLLVTSSPLERARATARILADALEGDGRPVEVQLEPGLMEIGQGAWEGLTHAELARDDAARYAAWAESGGLQQPPGAEAVPDAASRAEGAVRRLLADQEAAPGEALCLVSHGGILRLLAGRLVGLPDTEAWQLDVDNASLSVLERVERDGPWRIKRWNDTAHLAEGRAADDRQREGEPPAL